MRKLLIVADAPGPAEFIAPIERVAEVIKQELSF